MANPPITIGRYANVPAPGSPIRSAWPQQITRDVAGMQWGSSGANTDGNGCVWVTLPTPYANNGYRILTQPVSLGTATTAAAFNFVVVNGQVFTNQFLVRMFSGTVAQVNAICNFFWFTIGTLP